MWFHPPRNLGEFDGVSMSKAELENDDTLDTVMIDTEETGSAQDETKAVLDNDSDEDDAEDGAADENPADAFNVCFGVAGEEDANLVAYLLNLFCLFVPSVLFTTVK